MIKINLKKDAFDFDGSPAKTSLGKNITLSGQLVAVLGTSPQKEPLEIKKIYDWICEITETGKVEVDNSDKEKLKILVSESSAINTLIKGQILNIIDNSK